MKPLRKNPHIFDHLDVMKKRYVNIAISYKILHAIQTNLLILQNQIESTILELSCSILHYINYST